ncbi:MAG: M13 family metallopeptidase [Gammaproteobacteria bacterium]
MITRISGAALALLFLTACDDAGDPTAETAAPSATAAAQPPVSGIDTGGFDTAIQPADDFHEYVNGGWLESTPIPADRSSYGVGAVLVEQAEAHQRAILEEAGAGAGEPGSEQRKIGDFYASFMDEKAVEAAGIESLAPALERIRAISSGDELLAWFADSMHAGWQAPQTLAVFPDLGDSTQYIVYLSQDGLGLPDRDFYLKEGERFDRVRAAYPGYIAKLLELAGIEGGADTAAAIYALEKRMAEAQWPAEDTQNVTKIYNKYAVDDLSQVSEAPAWPDYLGGLGIADQNAVVITEPSYVTALGKLVEEVPLDTWKDYATFKLLDGAAPYLSAPFVDAQFEFDGRIVAGLEEQPPRWKRGVRLLNAAMGEAVGKVYVERHFPPEAKVRMDELVRNLLAAFRTGIDELEWMSDETKARAKDKLAKFTPKIGYPDEWRDYSKLAVEPGDLIGNVTRASAFEYQRNVDKLGEPIDRNEWGMTPQTVNAYYDPTKNEIVFPAAILQPPFFDLAADDAVNYGAIGAVIGHEISHGFDDQGSKFDGDGNMTDWWQEADRMAFDARGDELVEQYDDYEPLPGLNINGRLTLGENIGDLSGLAVAYRAYQISLGGEEAPVIDGMTGDQRFFLGFGQTWRSKMRDEVLTQLLVSNPHSPPKYRVNGIVRNFDPWYAAFDVQEGDALYLPPEERVAVW